jgi:ABC-type siderophore export system fused ATPase/permease subunit
MEAFSSALGVLTAMITPAVLISACGTLILSTSTRAGRVVDRVRALSDLFEELAHGERELVLHEERRQLIFNQLDKLTSRARLLQRSMTFFYFALGIFVLTSVAIGMVAITDEAYAWMPVVLALVGASFLFYGSVLLIFEARLALGTVHAEMDFLWRLGQQHASSEMITAEGAAGKAWWKRRA